MKTIFKIKYVLLTAITILTFSCSVEDGETGPQGEQGIAGENGNANIIASDWIASQHETIQVNGSAFEIQDARITEDVLSSALVMAYGKTSSSDIYPLPDSFGGKTYTFKLEPGSISFEAYAPGLPPSIFNLFAFYRYIIIPSGTSNGRTSLEGVKDKLKAVGVDINNYYQVADYYGLDY